MSHSSMTSWNVVGRRRKLSRTTSSVSCCGIGGMNGAALAMSACVIIEASITVPLDGKKLDAGAIAADAELAPLLMTAMEQLIGAIRIART